MQVAIFGTLYDKLPEKHFISCANRAELDHARRHYPDAYIVSFDGGNTGTVMHKLTAQSLFGKGTVPVPLNPCAL